MQEKHVPTARGRVLGEGDVDPAAGSRDEPNRLPVEGPVAERKQGIEVQVTKALFLKTNNWVQAPPPTFSALLKQGPKGTSKDVQKNIEIPRAPREAQRVKTRGPNPNPTAQAQSKRCLPLSTKTQNIIENVSI